jgi:hypothetical protein
MQYKATDSSSQGHEDDMGSLDHAHQNRGSNPEPYSRTDTPTIGDDGTTGTYKLNGYFWANIHHS